MKRRRWAWIGVGVVVFSVLFAAGVAASAIVDNGVGVNQIQKERARSLRISCSETNRRHDDTVAALDRLIARVPAGPQRTQAATGRAGVVLLIDALAPKRDCERLVEERVDR